MIQRALAMVAMSTALGGLAACSSGDPSKNDTATPVVMRLIAYKPSELDVPTGTAVTWQQQDAGFHTVTSGSVDKDASGSVTTEPDGGFASGRLAKGKQFTFTFEEEGTYAYFCEIHPATMTGRITVG